MITKLWDEDHPSYEGQFYSLFEAPFSPRNVQQPHPPIVVGGKGKKWIMPLVARYADAWNVPIGVTPKGIENRREIIRAECARVGRTPCDIEVQAFLVLYSITDVPFAGGAIRLGARLIEDERVAAVDPGRLGQADHRPDPHLRRRRRDPHHHEHPAALRSRAAAPLRQGGDAELSR